MADAIDWRGSVTNLFPFAKLKKIFGQCVADDRPRTRSTFGVALVAKLLKYGNGRAPRNVVLSGEFASCRKAYSALQASVKDRRPEFLVEPLRQRGAGLTVSERDWRGRVQ